MVACQSPVCALIGVAKNSSRLWWQRRAVPALAPPRNHHDENVSISLRREQISEFTLDFVIEAPTPGAALEGRAKRSP